jgi:hypothetical protein
MAVKSSQTTSKVIKFTILRFLGSSKAKTLKIVEPTKEASGTDRLYWVTASGKLQTIPEFASHTSFLECSTTTNSTNMRFVGNSTPPSHHAIFAEEDHG